MNKEETIEPKRSSDNRPIPSRWQLLRDVLAFQFKLAIDGLRDVILSPISIIAALVGLVSERKNPGKHFYRLLEMGHRSDRWINLFNAYDNEEGEAQSADSFVPTCRRYCGCGS